MADEKLTLDEIEQRVAALELLLAGLKGRGIRIINTADGRGGVRPECRWQHKKRMGEDG